MRTQNTFSILFLVKKSKAISDEAPLYARITVNSKRVDISLKRRIPLLLWDAKKKKVKGTSNEARLDRAVKVSHFGRMKVSIANQLLKIDSI
ncbi:hypothetical protein BFP77_05850 [Maribacter sp. 4U21]|uniref:Arm DNA-binding domain-containing protein n=1 Tax=Maribacter sp. 4U21 TaxID=1889779 RepID=UPI000C15A424|nr:Arm DNA-binding domain-containing protein [Maribacter sp. 4U21]PIB29665.1 hypothetical protein BFP77_05850 [Maribacter sp. 4U21]